MSTTRGRWWLVLGLGLAGLAALVVLVRSRSGGSGPARETDEPRRTRRSRPGGHLAPVATPGHPDRAPAGGGMTGSALDLAWPERAPAGQVDAGVGRPDPFAPPGDQFTLHPRMQARLAEMGRSERRIWTERLLGNLRNRVKEVEGRIARYEAEGNARAAHGERITLGRITDGIGALERQLARLGGPAAGDSAPDAGPP